MPAEGHNPMQHAEFEALISDVLDGAVSAADRKRFDAHRAACAACALMFSEAEAGMNWLATLDEVAPPANLVHNIMVATVGSESARAVAVERAGWWQKLRLAAWPVLQPVLQPRFALSFATAFFSISAALSLAGVRLNHLNAAELAPGNLANNAVRTYHETTARAAHYYDNLRFVYELESRYRELKNAIPDTGEPTSETQPKPNQNQNQKNHNNSSGEPRSNPDHQQYSRDQRNTVVAWSPSGLERQPREAAANDALLTELEPGF